MIQAASIALNRVFIVSGQSNAQSVDTTTKGTLYKDLKAAYPNDNIKLLEIAASGYAMKYWIKVDGTHGTMYNSIVSKYRTAIANMPQVDSVAFLWMQGEANANLREAGGYATNVGTYEARLHQLIDDLRVDLGAPAMKVVIGRISDYKSTQAWLDIRAIQERVAVFYGSQWINTDDCNVDVHYSAAGKITFAHRLASEAVAQLGPAT